MQDPKANMNSNTFIESSPLKTEPVFEENKNLHNDEIKQNEEEIKDNESSVVEEFSGEENEIEEDFNQETQEELLDIPTFLRRQAN